MVGLFLQEIAKSGKKAIRTARKPDPRGFLELINSANTLCKNLRTFLVEKQGKFALFFSIFQPPLLHPPPPWGEEYKMQYSPQKRLLVFGSERSAKT